MANSNSKKLSNWDCSSERGTSQTSTSTCKVISHSNLLGLIYFPISVRHHHHCTAIHLQLQQANPQILPIPPDMHCHPVCNRFYHRPYHVDPTTSSPTNDRTRRSEIDHPSRRDPRPWQRLDQRLFARCRRILYPHSQSLGTLL